MASLFITNWSHQVISTNGGGIWSTNNGTGMSIDTTVFKDSASPTSLKCVTAETNSYFATTKINGAGTITGRVYIYFSALPSGVHNYAPLIALVGADGTYAQIQVRLSDMAWVALQYLGTPVASSIVAEVSKWYRIDFKCVWGATTHTIDWYINGIPQTQYSVGSQTNTTFTEFRCGSTGGETSTYTVYFNHLHMTNASGDFPLGSGIVGFVSPASDGTHVSGANVMEFQDGTDIRPATTTAYTAVNSVPIGNTTTYIRQGSNSTTSYAAVKFAPVTSATIKGAMVILAYRAATATGDTGACVAIDEDAVATTIWGNFTTPADYSESSVFYKSACMPSVAGGFDKAALDAIVVRCGGSDDSNPNPWWVDLMMEYDYWIPARRNFPLWI